MIQKIESEFSIRSLAVGRHPSHEIRSCVYDVNSPTFVDLSAVEKRLHTIAGPVVMGES